MNEGSYHCAPVVMTGQGDTRIAWVPSREQPGKLRPTPAPGETLTERAHLAHAVELLALRVASLEAKSEGGGA